VQLDKKIHLNHAKLVSSVIFNPDWCKHFWLPDEDPFLLLLGLDVEGLHALVFQHAYLEGYGPIKILSIFAQACLLIDVSLHFFEIHTIFYLILIFSGIPEKKSVRIQRLLRRHFYHFFVIKLWTGLPVKSWNCANANNICWGGDLHPLYFACIQQYKKQFEVCAVF